jgi:hypothetical protein
LRYPDSTRKLAEWVDDEIETEQVVCPVDPGHRRGGKRISNLSVVLPPGAVQDFVWTWYSECLIQDRTLELFRREGFTGFDVKPVKARFKKGTGTPPQLWELVRTGWGGFAKRESGIQRIRYCDACQSVRYSGIKDATQLVDVNTWDGSDFFIVWPIPNFVFITQRVADCIRDYRMTGAVLERSDEYKPNPAVIEGFSPGRLSYCMSESRARELGEAAGIAEI